MCNIVQEFHKTSNILQKNYKKKRNLQEHSQFITDVFTSHEKCQNTKEKNYLAIFNIFKIIKSINSKKKIPLKY